MIGLDSNVLVRLFAKDDADQFKRAAVLLASLKPEAPGFVSLVALAEIIWVLRRRYGMKRAEIARCLEHLLDSPEITLESEGAVAQALVRFENSKADFADCLIERSGSIGGCTNTVTFDAAAVKTAGMKLL